MSRQDGLSRRVSDDDASGEGAHILHIDMDAFFASVELLDYPELRGKPVIIGNPTGRSVVTSATYEARRYGVTAAMPVSKAIRLCPQAVILEPHHARYSHFSKRVMAIFEEATPLVEKLSIDEAFLDVAGARRLLGTPAEIGRMLRRRVHEETGLTCSVGAAGSKFVAKLASSAAKPDGLLVVPPAETLQFLHPLPIRALWGVGGRTEESLLRMGLRTVGDVAAAPLSVLERAVGAATGRKLHELARGIDDRRIVTQSTEKSVGHEVTFDEDIREPARIRREILGLSDRVGQRLRAAGLSGRTVSIKVRYSDFTTVTRSRTLEDPSNVSKRFYEEAADLFDALHTDGRAIRLIGVRAEQLTEGGRGALLWDPDEEWREAETMIDSLRKKFGTGAIGSAALLSGTTRTGRDRAAAASAQRADQARRDADRNPLDGEAPQSNFGA
ncbi:DNA polymerase IV [Leifsonia sp. ALI-44-B]|uniref:DNA polymerase IV n=1 Tax=Leifsonia sp. ALI-44-B TaxID=1933776 RepID=UPI00097CAEE9|nr:DNA polymerase IV [Leifsonia sp. ALI-44-B]ONI63796.1 DNA polymerase IV [Leifsonia sp. ALI-44-B]